MKQLNMVTINDLSLFSRLVRPATATFTLLLILLILAACGSQSTPPAGHSIAGSYDGRAGYLLIEWQEGLRIMIWDDLSHGAHSSGSTSSTGDPLFHMDGGGQGPDGRSYQYTVDSADGLEATFTIDNVEYDLHRGKLFFIHTDGGDTWVEQLDVDLSGLAGTNAGIEAFGQYLPEIISFTDGHKPPPAPTPIKPTAPAPTVTPYVQPEPAETVPAP